jgi:hypothetical protein
MLRIQILGHISFFKLTSEYLGYILKKKIPSYKLNRNPTEVRGFKKIDFSKVFIGSQFTQFNIFNIV